MNEVFKKVSTLTALAAVTSVVSYSLNIVMARALGPSGFGELNFLMTVAAFCILFINFGIPETAPRLFQKFGADIYRAINTAKILNLLIISFVIFFVYQFMSIDGVLLTILLCTAGLHLHHQYEINQKNERLAVINLGEKLITLVVLLILLLFDLTENQTNITLVYCLAPLLAFSVQGLDLRYPIGAYRVPSLKYIYRTAAHAFLYGFSKSLFGHLLRLAIFWRFGAEQLGLFAVAWQFIPPASLYFNQVTRVFRLRLNELFAQGDFIRFKQCIRDYAVFLFVPACFGLLFIGVFGELLIVTIFGEMYYGAAKYVNLVAVYLLIVAIEVFASVIAICLSEDRYLMLVYGASGLLSAGILIFSPTDNSTSLILLVLAVQTIAVFAILLRFFLVRGTKFAK